MTGREFIIKKMLECVIIEDKKYPDCLLWITSPSIIRQKKLCRLIKSKFKYDPKLDKEKYVLFKQDLKNKYFHTDYDEIYHVLKLKFNIECLKIKEIVNDILSEDIKLSDFTTLILVLRFRLILSEDVKLLYN